jgi:hypothetical protein
MNEGQPILRRSQGCGELEGTLEAESHAELPQTMQKIDRFPIAHRTDYA